MSQIPGRETSSYSTTSTTEVYRKTKREKSDAINKAAKASKSTLAQRVGEKTEILQKSKEMSAKLKEMIESCISPKVNRLIGKFLDKIEEHCYFEDNKYKKFIGEMRQMAVDSDDDEDVLEMKNIAEKLFKNGSIYTKIINHMQESLREDPEVTRMERDIMRANYMNPKDRAKLYYTKRQESNGWWLYLMMHRNNRRNEEIAV